MNAVILITLLIVPVFGGGDHGDGIPHNLLHTTDGTIKALDANVGEPCLFPTEILMGNSEMLGAFVYAIEKGEQDVCPEKTPFQCDGDFNRYNGPFREVCERRGGLFVPMTVVSNCKYNGHGKPEINIEMRNYPICMATECTSQQHIVDLFQDKLTANINAHTQIPDTCSMVVTLGDMCGLERPYASAFIDEDEVEKSCASIQNLPPDEKSIVCADNGKYGAKWNCPNSCCACVGKELKYTQYAKGNGEIGRCRTLQNQLESLRTKKICKQTMKFGDFNQPSVACPDTCNSCS